jgi:serine protease Do
VVFTATAVVVYNFPCPSVTPFVFGVAGFLDPSDCNINGYYLDVLGFTLPSQRSLSIRLTSSTVDPWVGFYTGDGAFLAMNDDSLLGVARNSMLNVIVPGGSYLITPSAFGPGVTGDYTLTLYDRPALLAGCDANVASLSFMNPDLHYAGSDRSAVWLTRGVSFPETVTAADCADSSGPFYSDRAFIWLDSNSVLVVREASTDFDAYVTLFGPNGFRAFNDDSANATTTTNAYLVVQAPVSAAYLLDFGTRDTAATGNYTIAIAGVPTLPAAGARLGAPRGRDARASARPPFGTH